MNAPDLPKTLSQSQLNVPPSAEAVPAANPVSNIAAPIINSAEEVREPEEWEHDWVQLQLKPNESSAPVAKKEASQVKEPIAAPAPAAKQPSKKEKSVIKKPSVFARVFSKDSRDLFANIEAEEKRQAEEKAKQEAENAERAAAAMQGKELPPPAPSAESNPVQIEPIEPHRAEGRVKEPIARLQVVDAQPAARTTLQVVPVNPKRVFPEPYVNRALETFDTMAINIADCIFQQLVRPTIGTVQKSTEDLPELLKKAANFVLNLGDIADKEFGRLFDQQMVEPVMNKDFSLVLDWMTSNEFIAENMVEVEKQKLHTKISADLEPGLPAFQKEYLTQTLLWIFDSKRTKTFTQYIAELAQDNPNKNVQAKEVCRKAMKALVDVKVAQYCNYLNDLLQNRLGEILLKQLRNDVICPIVRLESEHLMDVIRQIGWTNIIDNGVVTTLYEHTNAYLAGVKARKEFDDEAITKNKLLLISRWEQFKKYPETMGAAEMANLMENQHKIEQWLKELPELQQDAFWNAFSAHKNQFGKDTVHPVVKNIIADKINKKEASRAEIDAQLETETFFVDKADQIVEIIFSGDMDQIDFWVKHLSLTQEFKDIFTRAKELINTYLAGKKVMGILTEVSNSELTKSLLNAITKSILHSTKSTMKAILTEQLKKQLERYSDPDEIKEIMATKVLNEVLVPKMVQIMAQNQVFKYLGEGYADIILIFLRCQDAVSEKLYLTKLLDKMYADTQKAFPSVKLEAIGVNREAFEKAVDPFISAIIPRLKKIRDAELVTLSTKSVIDLMTKYNSETIKADDRKQYGRLLQNLVFRMSTLSNTYAASAASKYDEKIENILSNIFVASMHDTRTSPAFTVDMLMETFKTMFAAGDPVKEMIFGDADVYESKEASTPLDVNKFVDEHIKQNKADTEVFIGKQKQQSRIVSASISMEDNIKRLKDAAVAPSRQELRKQLKDLIESKERLEKINYGDKDQQIEELKNAVETHRLTTTEAKFKRNLRIVTDLIYDIAMGSIADSAKAYAPTGTKSLVGYIAGFSAKKVALGTNDEFYAVVSDLFDKLLGNHIRNESLVYQVVDQVVSELFQTSKQVRIGNELKEKRAKANEAHRNGAPAE